MDKLVCRICLAVNGEFQNLFTQIKLKESNETRAKYLSEIICSFTELQIRMGDGLPEIVCNLCADQILQFYFFKIRCEESDKILREKLLESEKKFTENSIKTINEELFDKELILANSEDSFSGNSFTSEEGADLIFGNDKIKEFECNICFQQFSSEDLLLKHKITHENNSQEKLKEINNIQEKCLLCDYSGNLLEIHLNEHVTVVNNEQNSSCLICNNCNEKVTDIKSFYSHVGKKHKKKNNIGNKLSCPLCCRKFAKKRNLKKHINSHNNNTGVEEKDSKIETDDENGEFYCDHCNKLFKNKNELSRHLARVRLKASGTAAHEKKPHICEICYKAFNQISNLKDHLRTHNGEKPFLCPTCGKGFNQLGNLRQHQIRHSGVKSHICTTCGHGFASKGELLAHHRKHTGARPFVCDICGNGFTTSSSLTKHKRIHSGEKPYQCEFCKMKFSRSGILSRHRRIHTGEKPYVCEICSKAFTQSNDLNSHLRIHTGEKPYKCDECGQPFRQNSALRTHKKVHLHQSSNKTNNEVIKSINNGKKSNNKNNNVFVEDEENILMIKFEDIPSSVVVTV